MIPIERWRQHRIVVAVSGGADSVALFRTLVAIQSELKDRRMPKVIVAHVDHAIRGDASDDDRRFVQSLARQFDAAFDCVRLQWSDGDADRFHASEELLRDARYEALKKIAERNGARYLFTGHHFDDQVETILFRIFRGTGLSGLKGIPETRCDDWLTIVRPLLKVPKSEIVETLSAINQPFQSDQTNATNDYGRNFIRNQLLVEARTYLGPQVDESIARLAQHACDAVDQQSRLVDDFLSAHPVRHLPDGLVLATDSLRGLPPSMVRAVLIDIWNQQRWPVGQMTFERWQKIAHQIALVADSAGRYIENLPGDVRLEIDRCRVSVSRTKVVPDGK